jgi:hypothetical protein
MAEEVILKNPGIYSNAFSFLVRKIAERIGPGDANYAAYRELSSYVMPPEFMTWYYTRSDVPKFNKFLMFRDSHKISAEDVIKQKPKMVVDPFSGGRKRRSRVRRQKRRTNRRH